VSETPSRRGERALLWLLAAFTLLAIGFVSLTVLRPQLTDGDGRGGWSALAGYHHVVTSVSIEAGWASWGGFEIAAVEEVPGATVGGAWILRASEGAGAGDDWVDPDRVETPLDYLAALCPGLDLAEAALPQRLGHRERADLIVLWDITECAALVEGQQPEIVLHNLIGIPLRRSLDYPISAPAFDYETLVDTGICPPR